MRVVRVLPWFVIIAGIAGCSAPPAQAPAATAAPTASKPYGSLAQVMRGLPFPNSNIIFDTQTTDPGVPKKIESGQGATSTYANTYGGWQQVENAAVALSEVANLVTIPGRLCENGLPVPISDPTFQKGVKALADVGVAALEAAKTKNLDKMVDVSGAISDACLVCHEKYREVPPGKMRCVPVG
ncbi:MAG: hypothetical protein ABI868_01485 [Acidobacteriota bacterium]